METCNLDKISVLQVKTLMQNKVWAYLNVLTSWWRLLVYGLYCTCKPTESSYLFQCQIPNNKIPLLYGWVHFPHIHLKTIK